jgi:hypothetical protein
MCLNYADQLKVEPTGQVTFTCVQYLLVPLDKTQDPGKLH